MQGPALRGLLPLHLHFAVLGVKGLGCVHARGTRRRLKFQHLRGIARAAGHCALKSYTDTAEVFAVPPGLEATRLNAKLEIYARIHIAHPSLGSATDRHLGAPPEHVGDGVAAGIEV